MTRRRRLALLTPLALVATAAAPAPDGERRFAADRFDTVELASSDDVRIVPGAFSVIATGDPVAVAALSIEVRGGTLHVARRPGRYHDHGAKVTVTMPVLRGALSNGSGSIEARAVAGDGFVARLAGSGGIALPTLDARDVELTLAGSGSIRAAGRASRVRIVLRGSGDVRAATLVADAAAVTLTGSGSVEAQATRAATIEASGSGNVRILGHPSCSVSRHGSGSVTCG